MAPRTGHVRTPDGRQVAFAEHGPADGLPVAFLSGTPGGRLLPEPVPGFFDDLGARVIGFDRPGYGDSDPLPRRTPADVVGDVVAVLDHLGIGTARVLGGSGGGPHALALGALAPDRVERLVVQCGASPLEPDEVAGMVGHNRRGHERGHDRAALAEVLEQVRQQMLGQGLDSVLADISEADRARLKQRAQEMAVVLQDSLGKGPYGMVDDYIALWGQPWGFEPEDVQVPVRWYHGDADDMVPLGAGRRLAERLPDCELVVLPGRGHLLPPEDSEAIWRALLSR